MVLDRRDVESVIYNLMGSILLGKATEDDIKYVTALAEEWDMLPLLHEQFGIANKILQKV